MRKFVFTSKVDISVINMIIPLDIKNTVNALKIHANSFQTVSYFYRNWIKLNASALLKISKLCNFHSVEPDFPAKAGSAKCRRLPIVFNKTHIMLIQIQPQITE